MVNGKKDFRPTKGVVEEMIREIIVLKEFWIAYREWKIIGQDSRVVIVCPEGFKRFADCYDPNAKIEWMSRVQNPLTVELGLRSDGVVVWRKE